MRRELTQSRQLVGAQHFTILFLTDFSSLLLRLICYPLLLLLLLLLLIRGRFSKSYYSLPRLHALSVFRLWAGLQQQLLIIVSSTLVLLLILYQLAKRFVRMRIVL